MTYNFDPDKWYQNELAVIQSAVRAGKLTRQQYESKVAALDNRYEDMWNRLDGSYQIAGHNEDENGPPATP